MEAAKNSETLAPEAAIAKRPPPWAPFAYRDFRLLWSGMLIAQLGAWMQFTSLTYLVGIVLAHTPSASAINLGLLGASRAVPVIVLGPIAGYVADRYPRRLTLIIVNVIRAVLALLLAFASQGSGPWILLIVLVLAGLFSGAQAFDQPARQSWVSLIVPRAILSNAIGLNSIAGNGPLMIGPALAGILIATVGVYASFYVQAVTQWAVVIAVFMMRPAAPSHTSREPMLKQIWEGIRAVGEHPILRWVVLLLVVTCFCVRPYNLLLAAFAGHVLNVDAKAYGTMLAVGGLGTVFGALTTTIYNTEHRSKIWFISGTASGICLIILGYTHNFYVTLVLLAIMGWGSMSFIGSTNVLIQVLSPENMRGRALSLYSITVLGLVPLGTLLMGSFAAMTSLPISFLTGGVIGIVLGLWIWIAHPAVRHA